MDKVIETLYSIEERAQRIMETTSNEKAALKSEYDLKKSLYEKQVNETTDKKIRELESTLKKLSDDEYNEFKTQTQNSIKTLSMAFETSHVSMAKEIFKQITGV